MAIVNVKEHQSRSKSGKEFTVKEHPMTVNKTAMVAGLAKLESQGHVQSFTNRRAADQLLKRSPSATMFEHEGVYHVANPKGAKHLRGWNVPEVDGKPKQLAVDVRSPDHLIAAGAAMHRHLKQLDPGTPEFKHVLTQYNAVREAVQNWNKAHHAGAKASVSAPTKAKSDKAPARISVNGKASPSPEQDRSTPGKARFVGHDEDGLATYENALGNGVNPPKQAPSKRSPGHFEAKAAGARSLEEAQVIAEDFLKHHGDKKTPEHERAWAGIKHALDTLPSEAEKKAADKAAKEASSAPKEGASEANPPRESPLKPGREGRNIKAPFKTSTPEARIYTRLKKQLPEERQDKLERAIAILRDRHRQGLDTNHLTLAEHLKGVDWTEPYSEPGDGKLRYQPSPNATVTQPAAPQPAPAQPAPAPVQPTAPAPQPQAQPQPSAPTPVAPPAATPTQPVQPQPPVAPSQPSAPQPTPAPQAPPQQPAPEAPAAPPQPTPTPTPAPKKPKPGPKQPKQPKRPNPQHPPKGHGGHHRGGVLWHRILHAAKHAMHAVVHEHERENLHKT